MPLYIGRTRRPEIDRAKGTWPHAPPESEKTARYTEAEACVEERLAICIGIVHAVALRIGAEGCSATAVLPNHSGPRRRGHWRVLQLKQAGYLTTSDVARALGIGVTTLLRREGSIYPQAARSGGIRVYHAADVERLRLRNTSSRNRRTR